MAGMAFDGTWTGELRGSGEAEKDDGKGEVDASLSWALVEGVRRVAGLFGFGVCCELSFLVGGGEGGLAATLARKAALTALETVVSSAKLDFWRRGGSQTLFRFHALRMAYAADLP